jgi:site-specific recombinase
VSFSIAAYVGLRAYDVSGREQLEILRYLIVHGLKSPLRFLWPNYMRRGGSTSEMTSTASSEKLGKS